MNARGRRRGQGNEPPATLADGHGRTASGVPRRESARPARNRRQLGLIRGGGILVYALLAWFDASVPAGVAELFLGAALLQPVLARLVLRSGSRRLVFVVHDVALLAIVGFVFPDYFWLATVVLVSLMSSQASAFTDLRFVWIGVAVPVLVFAMALAADVEAPGRILGVVSVLALAHGLIGYRFRRSVESTRLDLQFALDAAGGFSHVTDLDSGLTELRGDVEQVVGWSRHEWMAMDQFRVVHPDDHDRFRVDASSLTPGEVIERTGRVRTRDGRWVWVQDTSRVVDAGDHIELHGFTVDVTARQIGLERVTVEASTDALTGLANRRALMVELDRLTGSTGHHLVLIDLDRFKDVNDTLGHEAGDVMLRVVADRIAEAFEGVGLVSRLGGDEFAIVLEDGFRTITVVERLGTLAERLAVPMEISGVNMTTSISAGVVRADAVTNDGSTMLRHADMAMYIAKHRHVTSVTFDRTMGDELLRRSMLSTQVGPALAAGEIRLHFQPIVDAHSGRIVSVEGLARWEHPRLGLLTPFAFLDLILLSDRAGQFTRTMVEEAVVAAAHLADHGAEITVAVNVPVSALEDAGFENWFVGTCRRLRVPASRLVFEVAEQDLHDEDATGSAIDRFAEIGVGIAVDDFGTGYATFDRLRWRNVDQLKLDHGIVRDVATSGRDGIIVAHMIELAHALGHTVVGEGVEQPEQVDALRSLGCELFQGYLFSKVVPLAEVVQMIDGGGTLPTSSGPAR